MHAVEHCEGCGNALPYRHVHPKRYCSARCRQSAYRARREERANERFAALLA